jgi:hypothetical protein
VRSRLFAKKSAPEGPYLYLLGGQQRGERPLLGGGTFYEYRAGRILRLDPVSGTADLVREHVSPPEARPDENPTILFKSGTVEAGRLYACTQTEVVIYDLPEFRQVGYVSHPIFNDLHHVRPTPEGTLLVANTGLDMVIEVTWDGEVLREWPVLDEDPWKRFSRATDYRKVRSTKPHLAHPNHVFYVGEEIWTTRFEQGDAICLTTPRDPVKISNERIHDGFVHGGHIYFTAVDGKVVVVDQRSLNVDEIIDLNPLHGDGELMGWCRGIAFDDEGMAWVGFSRLRPTQFRDNVAWVKNRFKRMKSTHLARFDLEKKEFVSEVEVEPHGLDAIFSIFTDAEVSRAGSEKVARSTSVRP